MASPIQTTAIMQSGTRRCHLAMLLMVMVPSFADAVEHGLLLASGAYGQLLPITLPAESAHSQP